MEAGRRRGGGRGANAANHRHKRGDGRDDGHALAVFLGRRERRGPGAGGGADEETAFLYGILSGGVEAATERISAGIPGLNKTGLLDDVLSRVASSRQGASP